jgi:hypothetical protein
MKASCLIVILLFLFPAGGVRAGGVNDPNVNLKQLFSVDYWPRDCVVSVYFVRNMFTSDEKQMLWTAIQTWKERANQNGLEINFVLAGETGGLIDCMACLTIARQGLVSEGTRPRVSFNVLRQNQTGTLISAWIGVERVIVSSQSLRTSVSKALERGLGTGAALSASRRHR